VIDHAALALGGGGEQHLLNDVGQARRLAFRSRPSADSSPTCGNRTLFICGVSPGSSGIPRVIDHDERAGALHHRALGREIKRHDRKSSPDRCIARCRARSSWTAERRARIRPWRGAHCRDAKAPGADVSDPSDAAGSGWRRSAPWRGSSPRRAGAPPNAASKPYLSSACFSPLRLPQIGMQRRAVIERVDVLGPSLSGLIMDDEIEPEALRRSRRERRSSHGIFQVVSTWSSGKGGFAG